MKAYVYKDEAYPVYGVVTGVLGVKEVEIPDELYERYKRVSKEYDEVQAELEKYSCE